MAAPTGSLCLRFDHAANKIDMADNDADIWDDTALIKAYDKAINTLKGASGHVPEDDTSDGKSKSKRNRHDRKYKKKKKRKNKWKVGDTCQAVFSQDDQMYDAIIKSINYKSSTCWVTYVGYGNEEEHHIADLMEAVDLNSTVPSGVNENDYDSMDYTEHTHSQHHPGTTPERPSPGHSHHQWRAANPGWYPPSPHIMPPFPPPPPVWGMTPYQTAPQLAPSVMPPGFPFVHMPHSGHPAMGLPAMPPPPAPDVDESDETGINTMLMAWYMSGYHTGYYQGLRQGKRLSSSQSEPKRPRHSKRMSGVEENNLSLASDSNNTEEETR